MNGKRGKIRKGRTGEGEIDHRKGEIKSTEAAKGKEQEGERELCLFISGVFLVREVGCIRNRNDNYNENVIDKKKKKVYE